ncbi:MAG: 2TM domain-containing protein [Alphaproteobacteria bacterium]
MQPDEPKPSEPPSRGRLRGFLLHLAGYGVVAAALVAFCLATDAEEPWFLLPIVGWGAVLAVHAAYVMGLLDGFVRR